MPLSRGSPKRVKDRTFIAVFKLPSESRKEEKRIERAYRNPLVVALSLRRKLESGEYSSRAELARSLGVSRVRVTQMLRLLDLAPDVVQMILNLGDPMPKRWVTERALRRLVDQPFSDQRNEIALMLPEWKTGYLRSNPNRQES